MNHVLIRRISLTAASASFCVLTAVLLVFSAVYSQISPAVANEVVAFNPAESDAKPLSFPIPISCTSLVVEDLAAYDGPFYEDESGREVCNVAALMLRNAGDQIVPYAHVVLHSADGTYVFDGFMIPSGATVLIPEKNARKLSSIIVENCFGWSTVLQENDRYDISVTQTGSKELTVTNCSDVQIHDLILYHKTFLEDFGFYMGGRAFETQIESIAPGQTVTVCPEFYAVGYSEVIYFE